MLVRVHLLVRDPPLQRRLRRLLAGPDVVVTSDAGRGPVLEAVREVVTDLCIARESVLADSLDAVVEALRELPDRPDLVVLSRATDPSHHTGLLARGAAVVLGERDEDEATQRALAELVASRADRLLLAHHARAAERPLAFSELVSESPGMQRLMRTVTKILPSNSTVLIEGETGVGKEVLARAIHEQGPRRGAPFVAINCSALPDALVESELFGHEAGAFTDALRTRRGKFELAHGGTIFLDEVGEMPLHLQTKLLRVLQDRELQRLGSEATVGIDVRIVAATNADLQSRLEDGRFRADLYYRLAVVVLRIPPLRERREDVPLLARRYLEHFAVQLGRPGLRLTDAALERLRDHRWAGNVRELVNAIERAALLADDDEIDAVDVEPLRGGLPPPPTGDGAGPTIDLRSLCGRPWLEARDALVARFGDVYVRELLRRHQGRIGASARAMGVNPRSLYDQMRKLGIDKGEFRDR